MTRRVSIHITGTVQGVGFRPTVYNYALQFSLTGKVSNTAQGVFIELQGDSDQIDSFVSVLKNDPPPQAKIKKFQITEIELQSDESTFSIDTSSKSGTKDVHIASDLATCSDCLKDISDPTNRRYGYPFTNCTNCGPRFTIVIDRPYDRALTSMKSFPMCPQCQKEYDDPTDRRFHAQPNACPACGPQLHLLGTEGDPLEETISLLKSGRLAAIKGLGGFNICCDPTNIESVSRLRNGKKRPNKSFALMMRDLKTVAKYCELSSVEEQWMTSAHAPIVLLKKKTDHYHHLSPDNNYLGVMLPYTPLHHLLMKEFQALVMTSANLADEPIAIDDEQIEKLVELKLIDFALSNNRPIVHRADDSILQVINEMPYLIRRSRGFTPEVFEFEGANFSPRLALGANMKNTFALARGNEIFLSQHIGELIDHRNNLYQQEQIQDFKTLLEIEPEVTIGDAHPGYENYALVEQSIQHHHAHFLSVLAEHNLFGKKILGIIADGTGFGEDQTIWGFEFFKTQTGHEFERVAHLNTFALPGGEIAIKEIRRVAQALGSKKIRDSRFQMLLDKDLNCPKTSSLGRLFDGVAAIIGACEYAEYEARGAILLQTLAERNKTTPTSCYHFKIREGVIDYSSLIVQIESDLDEGQAAEIIAYKFHQWVVNIILEVIKIEDAPLVALSGGCFQNRLLVTLLNNRLNQQGIEYYYNQMVPCGDGGIALGQIFA